MAIVSMARAVGGRWLWRRRPREFALAGVLLVRVAAACLTLVCDDRALAAVERSGRTGRALVRIAPVYTRAVIIWFAILIVAIANGALRVDVLIPWAGEDLGHVLSTIGVCTAILAVTWASIEWIGVSSRSDAVRIGLLWLAMTLAFEFLGGHYLFGTPWTQLLADYNVARGRVWVLVPLTTTVAPSLAAYARGLLKS